MLLLSDRPYLGSGWAIVVTAVFFACVHLPDLSFFWYRAAQLALLGLLLGWLRVQSGSIWPAVLAHSTNNLLAVVSWFVDDVGWLGCYQRTARSRRAGLEDRQPHDIRSAAVEVLDQFRAVPLDRVGTRLAERLGRSSRYRP